MRVRSVLLSALAALACSGVASATSFTFNQASDTFQTGVPKILVANCPSGFFASGGGYAVQDSAQKITYVTGLGAAGTYFTAQATIPTFVVGLNQPSTGNGDGWAVSGVSNKDQTITVYVMCISRN